MLSAALCPNCESHRHARCCSWCGKIHTPKRLHNEHCSAKCARAAQHADQLSDAMEDEAQEGRVMQKKSNEERQAEEIERQSRLFCRWCGERVDEHRVYFGVVGPFCDVACRDTYASTP